MNYLFTSEVMAMLLCLGEIGFAGYGLRHLLRKTIFREFNVIECATLWLFTALFIAMVVGLAGLSMVPGLALMTLLFAGAGVYFFITDEKPWLKDRGVILQVVVWGVLLAFHGARLARLLDPLIGLPTHHDGIAHTLFFLRVLEFGTPIVSGHILPLNEFFGEGVYPYYPTGSHTFAAILTWWWHKFDLFNAAKLAKGFLLADLALLPWILYSILRRLAPKLNWALMMVLIVLSALHFRMPFWAVDSGGFSRIIAYTYSSVLIGILFRRDVSFALISLIFGIAIPAGFALHPAGSWYYLSAAYGLFVVWSLIHSPRDFLAKKNLLSLFGAGVSAAAFTVVFHLLLSASHKEELLQLVPSQGLNVDVFWARLHEIFRDYRSDFTKMGFITPRGFLLLLGALFVPVHFWRKKELPFHIWYAFGAFIVGAFVFIMGASDISVFKMAIAIFFDQSGRVGESFYLSQAILRLYGLLGLTAGVQWVYTKFVSNFLSVKRAQAVAMACVAAIAIIEYRASFKQINAHLLKYFAHYGSPFKDPMQDVADLVIQNTPRDALILYRPLEADVLEPVTGRPGLFFYGYCPSARPSPNCQGRTVLLDTVIAALQQAKSPQGGKCFGALSSFRYRPVYVLVDRGLAQALGPIHCDDGIVVGEAQNYLLIKPQG